MNPFDEALVGAIPEVGVFYKYLESISKSWRLAEHPCNIGNSPSDDSYTRAYLRGNLFTLVSLVYYKPDTNLWIHTSTSVRSGGGPISVPDYDDLCRVKNDFFGKDRWAFQVFASADEHININPYVLHLYGREDGTRIHPDFTWGLGTI